MSCRCASSHAAGRKIFISREGARARCRGGPACPPSFFLTRRREGAKKTGKMAACLAAARQVTPPGGRFLSHAKARGRGVGADLRVRPLFFSREGAKARRRQGRWRHVLPLRVKSRRREEGKEDFSHAKARRREEEGKEDFSHAKARRREEDREDGGMSCRCASSHAAGRKIFISREGARARCRGGPACPPSFLSHAKARRREEDREDGGMSCRCASSHAAGRKIFISREGAGARCRGGPACPPSFFLTRRREGAKKTGKMAACLAAARQVTPPGGRQGRFFSREGAKARRGRRGRFFSREGAKARICRGDRLLAPL
ncbi:hypothetical protein J3R75_003983 [Oligosphaera ethanolica]|uniref:Uncharacterized protein n=1 Tax=Oligosphaera ethanolica TaxID=760260 RepID=A0AAE3VK96_9BACT|nr:hypothetical protein [Oligosphaera ethanolica]